MVKKKRERESDMHFFSFLITNTPELINGSRPLKDVCKCSGGCGLGMGSETNRPNRNKDKNKRRKKEVSKT